MRRRLLILIGSFGIILAIFMLVAGALSPPASDDHKPADGYDGEEDIISPSREGVEPELDEAGPRGGNVLNVVTRDEEGRLERIYYAARWEKLDEETYEVERPCMEARQADGRRLYLTAERGIVNAEEIEGGANIKSARLIGDVRIYMDPVKEVPNRPTLADMDPTKDPMDVFKELDKRAAELVRILVDDLKYVSDPQEISTDSRVFLWSPEADIVGRGLSVLWNEEPMELRKLEIANGSQIAVYNIPEGVDLMPAPGSDAAEEPAESVAGQRPPRISPAQTEPKPEPAPVVSDPDATADPDLAAEDRSAPKPLDELSVKAPEGQNIYVAEFNDEVHVDHEGRQMRGAEKLTIQFEWTGRTPDVLDDDEEPQPTPTPGRSADELAAGTGPREPGEGDAAATEDAEPAPPEPRSSPTTITWRGPLVIRPIGQTATPSDRKYLVTAEGNAIHLVDQDAEMTCNTLEFRHPEKTGQLGSAGGEPTRLLLGGEQEVIARRIRFDIPAGKVFLDGPGRISQAPSVSEPTAEDIEDDIDALASRGGAGSIDWAGKMEANLGEMETTDKNGETKTQQFIQDAIFFDDVVLSQGLADEGSTGQAGDHLRCDVLRVWMMKDGGQIMPEVAVAKGNVSGRQAGSNVAAGKVTVFFDMVEKVDDEGAAESRLQPTIVVAEDDVRLSSEQDGQTLEAFAYRLESDIQERVAVLYGKDEEARVQSDQNVLAGERIQFDQNRQSAVVKGPGYMRFDINEDMDGNDLSTPRPVRITWTEGMEFQSQTNTAAFVGDVKLTSGTESMACREMQLLFERDESAEAEAAEALEDDSPELGMSLERYSRRELAMIMASGAVDLRSHKEDADQKLIQRLQLTGERLMYDVRVNELTMVRAGTLVVEDYRPPGGDDDESSDDVQGAQRPSQSAFRWTKKLRVDQDTRMVEADGDVQLVHRSGDEVLVLEGLDTPEWGQLPDGRRTLMHCQHMEAHFGEPEQDEVIETTGSGDLYESGPKLGPLERFIARGEVNLVDSLEEGNVQVLCQRMNYNQLTGNVEVWGFLEGKPPADANLIFEPNNDEPPVGFTNPAMLFVLDESNVIEVRMKDDVYGSGGN